MILSDEEITELQTIWDENLTTDGQDFITIHNRKEYYRKLKIGEIKKFNEDSETGHMLLAVNCVPLGEWYRNKFDIDGPLGGQLAFLKEPLGVHVDVLHNVPDHFSQKLHTTTRYAVLKTDCTDTLHTYIFDQYADRTKWSGFKTVNETVTGLTDTPIEGHEGLDHLIDKASSLGLTVKEKIPLPIGKVVSWESHYLHSGQSFVSAGGSWKFQITILTPTREIKYA